MFGKLGTIKRIINRKVIDSGLIRKKSFSVNGKSIVLTNLNESNLLKGIALNGFESYENEVVTLIKNYPWEICAFFDVGANIGIYSILTELYHPKIKVVSVEPFPKNIEYIKNVKKINLLNFELIEKAIDRESGEKKTFYFPTAKNSSKLASSASLINSFKGTGGIFDHISYETVEVVTTTLNSIVSPYRDSCLIKLDCEGNELRILESSIPILERSNVDFIVEIMINDKDKHDVFSIMKKHGYKGFLITNAGLVCEERPLTFPYPEKKNRTIWKNHFFTKKDISEIKDVSEKYYGYWI
jgi:FkbM family methyltransferase